MITASPAGPQVRVEQLWGTAITFEFRDRCSAERSDAVFAWFRRVDDLFSTWRSDSEVSRIGRGDLSIRDASPEVRTVLELCEQVKQETSGAFDAGFARDPRVARRDGFGPVDPSGLVKGWALQRAGEQLRAGGTDHFLINAGGDVLVAGEATPGCPWRIGVQHPWRRDRVAVVLAVSDLGVATSGRYERGDHIIDPATGAAATGSMSVTVVDEDLARADAYATAALVMGPDGPRWLADRGIAAAIVDNDGVLTTTPQFQALRSS